MEDHLETEIHGPPLAKDGVGQVALQMADEAHRGALERRGDVESAQGSGASGKLAGDAMCAPELQENGEFREESVVRGWWGWELVRVQAGVRFAGTQILWVCATRRSSGAVLVGGPPGRDRQQGVLGLVP